MRKLAIALALTTTAIASPALARDDAWYIGIEGGGMIVEDGEFDVGAVNNAYTLDHKTGYDVDGIIGYDFGGFRLEAEVGYKSAEISALTTSVFLPSRLPNGNLQNELPNRYIGAGGETTVLSFMVNGLLDFGDDDGLNGFVGGGVGVARVKDQFAVNDFGSSLDDSDTGFAWQAIAGVRTPLSENVDIGLKYRFFNADKVNYIDLAGRSLDGRFR